MSECVCLSASISPSKLVLAVHHRSGMSRPQSHLFPAWDEICTCFNRPADGYQRHHLREFRLARNSQMCIRATLWSCWARTCLISPRSRATAHAGVRTGACSWWAPPWSRCSVSVRKQQPITSTLNYCGDMFCLCLDRGAWLACDDVCLCE